MIGVWVGTPVVDVEDEEEDEEVEEEADDVVIDIDVEAAVVVGTIPAIFTIIIKMTLINK